MFKKLYNFYSNSPLLTTWMSYLTKLLAPFFLIPLLLIRYSPQDISVYYIYVSIWSLVLVFDSGFGSTFVRLISYEWDERKSNSLNSGENSKMKTIIYVMEKFYLKIWLICLLILSLIFTIFMFKIINQSTGPNLGWGCWFFFVLSYPFLIYNNVYSNYLQGIQKIPILKKWETFFLVISLILGSVLVFFKFSVHVLVINLQIFLILNSFCNKFLYNKFKPNAYFKKNIILINQIKKEAIGNAFKSGIGLIMIQGLLQIITFIYTNKYNSTFLAPYFFSIAILNNIKSFSQVPFYSRIPEFCSLMNKNKIYKLKVKSSNSMKLVYIVFIFSFLLIGLYINRILNLVGSNIKFIEINLWIILGAGALIERFGAMHLQIYSTTNHILWHKMNGISGIILILLFVILLPRFNIYAYGISHLLAYLFYYSWGSAKLSYSVLKTNFWDFEKQNFIAAIIIFLLSVVLIKYNS